MIGNRLFLFGRYYSEILNGIWFNDITYFAFNFRNYFIMPSNVSRPHEMTRKTSDLV